MYLSNYLNIKKINTKFTYNLFPKFFFFFQILIPRNKRLIAL
jgi:hypothetical protein